MSKKDFEYDGEFEGNLPEDSDGGSSDGGGYNGTSPDEMDSDQGSDGASPHHMDDDPYGDSPPAGDSSGSTEDNSESDSLSEDNTDEEGSFEESSDENENSDVSDDRDAANEGSNEGGYNDGAGHEGDSSDGADSDYNGTSPYDQYDGDEANEGADETANGTNPDLYNDDNVNNDGTADESSDTDDEADGGSADGNDADKEGNDEAGQNGDKNEGGSQDDGLDSEENNQDGKENTDNSGDTSQSNDDGENGKAGDSADSSNNSSDGADDGGSQSGALSDSGGSSSDGGMVDKAMGEAGKHSETVDKINKARNLKKLTEMKKEDAEKELVQTGKDLIMMKIKFFVVTTLGPYILAAIAILLMLLLIISLVASVTTSTVGHYNPVKEQCNENDKNSEDTSEASGGNTHGSEEVAKKTYIHMMENVKDLTPAQAAGALGAFSQESTMNPKSINGDSGAYGLAQWLGGRLTNLEKFASDKGKDKSDLGVQLDFLIEEMKGSEKPSLLGTYTGNPNFYDSKTPEEASERWSRNFERMGENEAMYEVRANYAKGWYAKFKDLKVDTSKAKDMKSGDSGDNIADAQDAAGDNSDSGSKCGGDDEGGVTKGEIGDSVKANGGSGEVIKRWGDLDKVPKKYKKYITLPDLDMSIVESSPFAPYDDLRGQCTELTWSYMKQMYSKTPSSAGNGGQLAENYKAAGAKTTNNPTVGYGWSSYYPYAGSGNGAAGHTGVVAGVLPDGKWILVDYNGLSEAPTRVKSYALVDGNPKSGGARFFSGLGKAKVKAKESGD